MKILILGATGTFGTALTEKLSAETEHQLTLFSRHAEDKYQNSKKIKAVNGNAVNIEDLRKVLPEQEVVYSAISGNELPTVAENLRTLLPEFNIKRLLFMSAVGIYNEIPADMDGEDNLDNEPAQIPNRKAADIIENSDLNYTILRPGYLREGSPNDYVLTVKGQPAKGYISTIPSVVKFAVDLMEDDKLYSRKSVSITKNMAD